ncbi:MAG: UDP-N-acetylmuramoyl-L-alanine--D-glutamate ligase, partial [bacterium]
AIVAGNIGTPLTAFPTAAVRKADAVVLEVSSHQAEALRAFRANVAVVLNLTPDHLGRHRTMRRYAAAKARLLELQARGDTAVLNADDARVRAMAGRAGGRVVWFSRRRGLPRGFGVERSPLPGPHNRENLLAACAAARAAGLPVAAIRRAVATFRGVPHRLENVGVRGGVLYVNDSKATNVDSTASALRSCERPVILLMGGRDKGSPYAPLRPLIRERCRAVVLYGEARHLIARTLRGLVRTDIRRTLAEAVTSAAGLAQPDDVVLLSPACASFDQFRDFECRGDAFRALVKRLPR